jgi:hypothetical protein
MSWTNSTVQFNTITKAPAPLLNQAVLWRTSDSKSCYSWGGGISIADGGVVPPRKLWKFTSDGDGKGLWAEDSASANDVSNLERRVSGSGTMVGDTGYYIGGLTTKYTDLNAADQLDIPRQGVISFNSSSKEWDTESSIGLNDFGTATAFETVSLPAFGLDNRPLLFILGGQDPALIPSNPSPEFLLYSNVTIYDPYIGRWFSQMATGEIPSARVDFCAVSMKGDNGTWEM